VEYGEKSGEDFCFLVFQVFFTRRLRSVAFVCYSPDTLLNLRKFSSLMPVPACSQVHRINRTNLVLGLLARLVFDRSFSSFTPARSAG
jgi:hypothetical protein